MAAKTTTSTSSASPSGERPATARTPGLETVREGFVRQADQMAAWWRLGDATAQVHRQTGERCALLFAQAADNLRKADSPAELLEIQSMLVVYGWQEAWRHSQELVALAATFQRRAAAPQEAGAERSPASQMTEAALEAAAPMVQAWQQMFTGAAAAAARH